MFAFDPGKICLLEIWDLSDREVASNAAEVRWKGKKTRMIVSMETLQSSEEHGEKKTSHSLLPKVLIAHH